MIYMCLADGFEEVEALTPLDLLRRAGAEIYTVGIGGKTAVGSHDIAVCCDLSEEEADPSAPDMLILPGGMPGTTHLDGSDFVQRAIDAVQKKGGHLAAICAAPLILGKRGLLENKCAVCYPGFENELRGATIHESAGVVTDGNITTAKGMGVAFEFGMELIRLLFGKSKAMQIKKATMGSYRKTAIVSTEDKRPPIRAKLLTAKEEGVYTPAPLTLFASAKTAIEDRAQELEAIQRTVTECFESFRIPTDTLSVKAGPRFANLTLRLQKGERIVKLLNLTDDLRMALAKRGVRALPCPEERGVRYEIPFNSANTVFLSSLLNTRDSKGKVCPTAICMGRDTYGNPVFSDVAKLPHLLVAGEVGTGKSVFLHSMIISLLQKAGPDAIRLLLIDPKMVEFSAYEGLPHLLCPVITETKKAIHALEWICSQMEKRYEEIERLHCRNIDSYNQKVSENPSLGNPMPRIVIIIDELGELMLTARKEMEEKILFLAARAKAAGIHLILATQDASKHVVSGVIRDNIPSRLCFKLPTEKDSRAVLERKDAKDLIKNGDMLFHPVGLADPIRVQGAYISEKEIRDITAYIKKENPFYSYENDICDVL